MADMPTIFVGQRLPLSNLSPDSFEQFVRGCLTEVGPLHGFEVTGGSGGPGDGGFDANGIRIFDGKPICIQSKRQTARLSLAQVGIELAKVALKSKLEGSEVVEHYFVTSGKVAEGVRSALREGLRTKLISHSERAVNKRNKLPDLIRECTEKGIDVVRAVSDYVLSVEKIIVWDGDDFDTEMGRVWSKLKDLIGQFFFVQPVLLEHPRPDFDEATYLSNCLSAKSDRYVPLLGKPAELPTNLSIASAADPLAPDSGRAPSRPPVSSGEGFSALEALTHTSPDTCSVLLGAGGAGKTTTLEMTCTASALLRKEDKNSPLPILICLKQYRGDLHRLVKNSLNIHHGHWASLPGRFLLLCDGLNEIEGPDAQKVLDEITEVIKFYKGRVSCVLSTRSAGLRYPVYLPCIRSVIELYVLNMDQILTFSGKVFEDSQLEAAFVNQIREKLSTLGYGVFSLPFALKTAARVFKETGMVPDSIGHLLEHVFLLRFKRNQELSHLLDESLHDIPFEAVQFLAQRLSFALRVERQKSIFSLDEFVTALRSVLNSVSDNDAPLGIRGMTDINIQRLLRHYEVINVSDGGWVTLGHDLTADYFASFILACKWTSYLNTLQNSISDDAWMFASPRVPEVERKRFLDSIVSVDLLLAARCAVEMGESSVQLLESLVFQEDASQDTFKIWRATNAMVILGSKNCADHLKTNMAFSLPHSIRHGNAQRALARMGDEGFLSGIMPGAEKWASDPYTNASGGEIALWEIAPLHVALRLARKRLREAGPAESVFLSMKTVRRYGDASDADALEYRLRNASDLKTLSGAFHFLHHFDAPRSIATVQTMLGRGDPFDDVYLMELLASVSAPVDSEWLVSLLLDEHKQEYLDQYREKQPAELEALISNLRLALLKQKGPEQAEEVVNRYRVRAGSQDRAGQSYVMFKHTVSNLLMSCTLTDDATQRLRENALVADTATRWQVWQIASKHQLANFDDLASDLISQGDIADAGLAAAFAKERAWPEERERLFIEKAVSRLETDKKDWLTSGFSQIVDYLFSKGEIERIAEYVLWEFEELIKANIDLLNGQRPRLPGKTGVFKTEDLERLQFDIKRKVARIISILSTIADRIPKELILGLMDVDLERWADVERRTIGNILRQLSDDELDDKLSVVQNIGLKLWLLSIVSELGVTDARVTLVRTELRQWVASPALITWLERAIENMWCEKTLEAVTHAIAEARWHEETGDQHVTGIVDFVARRVSRRMAISIIQPFLTINLHPWSYRILKLWFDKGMADRSTNSSD
ncbi:MAG: hypothetical protein P9L99_11240 [Candidatus Lernaella stagnicola]|nr:hypothetical protein [Candidatus Lernaella stagnicola]